MTTGIRILDGLSEWVREQVGPEAENRVDEDSDNGETRTDSTAENDDESEDHDSPACCSASGNTDVTVLDS